MDFLGELLALVGMVFVAVFPLVMAFVGARAGSRTSDYYAKTWGTVISLAAMVCLAFVGG